MKTEFSSIAAALFDAVAVVATAQREGKSRRTAPRFTFCIEMFLLGITGFEDFAQLLLELRIFIGGAALVDMGAKPKTVQNK